ncbi:MAG: prepilin-type N-terminal cleavage/methylation domain-containing protein [Desulfobacterales bacterium]|jgi:type IV pilus assembly protein PilV
MRQGNKYIKKTGIKKSQKDQGFTLIEVLIAISIFAVGLLAVATMQTSAIKVNSTADQITTRMTWAQDKIEELIAMPYSDPWLQDLGDPPSGMDSAGNVHQETSDGYIISWTVTDNNPIPNTKLIVVSVTGRGKTSQLTSMKSDW